jgi:glycosyltransferase involved in cell wall biosynthesis
MKVIALCQAYNEGMFMHQCLQWATGVVDHVVIMEGSLSPFGNLPQQSTDDTRKILEEVTDHNPKTSWLVGDYEEERSKLLKNGRNREAQEGINKNFMLQYAIEEHGLEHGDLIFILDVDEFWHEENFLRIVEKFRKDDSLVHVPVEEYQFAYNLRTCFNAEHNGRFMRYVAGARFGDTNHFVHPDRGDITKDYSHLAKREDTLMCHLCWCKHPLQIREKVVSFNRQSFTLWYNLIYLGYPLHGDAVYQLNQKIPPFYGKGFCEGQHEPLYEFEGELPWPIRSMTWDHAQYIRKHHDELVIR